MFMGYRVCVINIWQLREKIYCCYAVCDFNLTYVHLLLEINKLQMKRFSVIFFLFSSLSLSLVRGGVYMSANIIHKVSEIYMLNQVWNEFLYHAIFYQCKNKLYDGSKEMHFWITTNFRKIKCSCLSLQTNPLNIIQKTEKERKMIAYRSKVNTLFKFGFT